MPGIALSDFAGLEADFTGRRHAFVTAPGLVPSGFTDDKRGHCDQLRAFFVQRAVVLGVPAVAADQDAQAPGRGVDHIQLMIGAGLDIALFFIGGQQLALRSADGGTLAVKHHAAVVQRAGTDQQFAVFNARVGQGDAAGHQGYPELFGQAAKQGLVIVGHAVGFHAQMSIVDPAFAVSAQPCIGKGQRVADGQPVHRLIEVGGLIQLVFFTAKHQPGTDMFRQYHYGFAVDQPGIAGAVQVGRQFQMDQRQALVVAG